MATAYWLDASFLWRNDGFNGFTGLTDIGAGDCFVDGADFAVFVSQWLQGSVPP